MKRMISRYNGKCTGCHKSIKRGEAIQYDRSTRKAYHDNETCTRNAQKPFEPDFTDIAYEDQCAAMCGYGL